MYRHVVYVIYWNVYILDVQPDMQITKVETAEGIADTMHLQTMFSRGAVILLCVLCGLKYSFPAYTKEYLKTDSGHLEPLLYVYVHFL